jgi:hypothetical protein
MIEVLDYNDCRDCNRPIQLLDGIGWLHAELPQFAYDEFPCGGAAPLSPRCPWCDRSVPSVQTRCGLIMLLHDNGNQSPCNGSGRAMAEPK